MDIKQALWEEATAKLEAVTKVNPASNEDKTIVDEIVKLSDRVIELEKIELDHAEKEASRKAEYDFKNKQLEEELKFKREQFEAELKLKEKQLEAELRLKQKQLEEEIKARDDELKLKARQAKDERISRLLGHVLTVFEIVVKDRRIRWGTTINYHYETKGYLPSTNVGKNYTSLVTRSD